jgi:hypothetical protein
MNQGLWVLLLIGVTTDVSASDMLTKEEYLDAQQHNAQIREVARLLVAETVTALSDETDPNLPAPSVPPEKPMPVLDEGEMHGLATAHYEEIRDDFLKGRYDRSKARLPENIDAWRSKPDISNPGADLANFPNSAFTLPQGRAYIEVSPVTWYGKAPYTAQQYNGQYLLRYGATDDIELRLFGNGLSWKGGPYETTGFSPIAFDTKIHLFDEQQSLFLPAAGFEGYIQTDLLGSHGFSQGTYGGMTLNFDQSLPFDIDAEYNLGANQTRKLNGDKYWQFNFQWALQKDVLNKDLALFVHGFYNAMTLPRLPAQDVVYLPSVQMLDMRAPTIAAVGAGTLWTVNSRWVMWAQCSGGVTHYSPNVITDLGFAVAF